MRFTVAVFVLLAMGGPARAQFAACVNLDRVNGRLAGHVVDYTDNHGSDHRLYSPILGMPRDLYVYLPPGYDPRRAYSLVLFFHMAYVDEHYFVGSDLLPNLEALIGCGEMPPVVIACPDGTYGGQDRLVEKHSFYVNGLGGRVEDHIFQEVIPFLASCYSIRPERQAHGLVGASSGGFGAMSLAIRHRDSIGAVATFAAPLNLRYSNVDGRYFEPFDPATYRWKTRYNPNEVIGILFFGLQPVRARRYISPVFGRGDEAVARIAAVNPADLLFSTDLKSGELAIYVQYGARDEFNFDAQDESFLWMAAQKGIEVTAVCDPEGDHKSRYFRDYLPCAFRGIGRYLLPPTDLAPSGAKGTPPSIVTASGYPVRKER